MLKTRSRPVISKIFVMLRSLQTSESWPSFVRSRLTPPTSTPSVVESIKVVSEKSTTTWRAPCRGRLLGHDLYRLDHARRARRRRQAAAHERGPALARLQRPQHHEDLRDHGPRPRLHDLPHAGGSPRADPVVEPAACLATVRLPLAALACIAFLAAGCGTGGIAKSGSAQNG